MSLRLHVAVSPTSCPRNAGLPQVLREALTARTAPGAGFSGELGMPSPVPASAEGENSGWSWLGLCSAAAARQRSARLLRPGTYLLSSRSGPGPGAARGPAWFRFLSLRASGSVRCAEGSQLMVPLRAQTFFLWLPGETRSLQFSCCRERNLKCQRQWEGGCGFHTQQSCGSVSVSGF